MNDWYIDRSKNFVNNALDSVITYLANNTNPVSSNDLINSLVNSEIFDEEAGNLNAALTRFRDHGIINNDNMLGEPAFDYYYGVLTKDELIVDLFFKRPARKKDSPDVKPLVIICKIFDIMFDILPVEDDIYLSFEECHKFLFEIDDINCVTIELVDSIIENRTNKIFTTPMKQNEITNLSIWTNALCNTPIFQNTLDRTIIKPNPFAKDFINYIAIYGHVMSETPTDSNKSLYNYYCDSTKGLCELVPDVLNENVIPKTDEDIRMIFEYLFGKKITPGLDVDYYMKKPCFGIYYPFIFLPGIPIRKVIQANNLMGKKLLEYLNRR